MVEISTSAASSIPFASKNSPRCSPNNNFKRCSAVRLPIQPSPFTFNSDAGSDSAKNRLTRPATVILRSNDAVGPVGLAFMATPLALDGTAWPQGPALQLIGDLT